MNYRRNSGWNTDSTRGDMKTFYITVYTEHNSHEITVVGDNYDVVHDNNSYVIGVSHEQQTVGEWKIAKNHSFAIQMFNVHDNTSK